MYFLVPVSNERKILIYLVLTYCSKNWISMQTDEPIDGSLGTADPVLIFLGTYSLHRDFKKKTWWPFSHSSSLFVYVHETFLHIPSDQHLLIVKIAAELRLVTMRQSQTGYGYGMLPITLFSPLLGNQRTTTTVGFVTNIIELLNMYRYVCGIDKEQSFA